MKLNDRQRQAIAIIAPLIDAAPGGRASPDVLVERLAAGIPRGYPGLGRMLLTQLGKKGAIRFAWVEDGFRVELLPAGRGVAAAMGVVSPVPGHDAGR